MHFITLHFLEQSDFQSTTGMSSDKIEISIKYHCLKSVQIRSFFVFNPNAGKYGPEKTPYLGIFCAVYQT